MPIKYTKGTDTRLSGKQIQAAKANIAALAQDHLSKTIGSFSRGEQIKVDPEYAYLRITYGVHRPGITHETHEAFYQMDRATLKITPMTTVGDYINN